MRQKYLIVGLLFSIVGIILISGCVQQIPQSKENNLDTNNSDTFVEIFLDGGGFYGGVNPPTENRKIIKSNGEIIISRKSLYDNGTGKNYFVSRSEVEGLADFISAKGFFNMEDVYDCSMANQKCEDRKNHYPPAVPLKIGATIGNLNKTVTITVYEDGMIEYPKELAEIVNNINEVINKAQK